MWEKKTYPLDKSRKKSKGIRKQRHHAVSSNQLLIPDRRGNSSLRAHWSRLNYGSASWMLSQLMNEYDDGMDDYDNEYNMDYAHGDIYDMGIVEYEVGEVETDWVERQVYGLPPADHGGDCYDMPHADHEVEKIEPDDLSGGVDSEEEDAELLEYYVVELESDVVCEEDDGWTLISGDI